MISQIVLMIALVVMWKQLKMPFSRAFERCFVCGVVVYFALGLAASVLLTVARLQPVQMLLRQMVGVASLLVFAALHYLYGMGILKSALTWIVIYVAARILVMRIENRTMRHLRIADQK